MTSVPSQEEPKAADPATNPAETPEVQELLRKLATSVGADPATADPSQLKEVLTRVADFLQLNPAASRAGNTPLDFLLDVTVPITAELGVATLPIGELLKLSPGSVVELNRYVSDSVDLTVRGVLFARGEVVVVEDRFAVRIKELMQPRGGKKGGR